MKKPAHVQLLMDNFFITLLYKTINIFVSRRLCRSVGAVTLSVVTKALLLLCCFCFLLFIGNIFSSIIFENSFLTFCWYFIGFLISGIGIYLTEKETTKISYSIENQKKPSEIKKQSKRLNELFSGGIF